MQLEKWLKTDKAFLTLSSLLALTITFLLYGKAVSIPFYSDDLLQIPWARTAPLSEIWGTLNPFSHFRPVQFSLWRLWQVAAGDLTPVPLRSLNLLLHAGSGGLTGYLAFRLIGGDWFAGLGSTILFALFPFSYDALLWISSAAYPLTVFLGLLSVHCWISFSQLKRWGWFFAALACALASALSLESGILVGILLIASDILILKQFSWRRVFAPLTVSVFPFLLVNFLTPTPATLFDSNRLLQNGAMLVQTTTFPFSFVLTRLADKLDTALLLWTVGGLFGTLIIISGYRSKKLFAPLTFAILWVALWGIIPAVTQTYTWDRDPPRAFYPCAVGIALIWGMFLTHDPDVPQFKKYLYRFTLGLTLLLPIRFNMQTAGYYQQAGSVLQQVLDTAAVDNRSEAALFINLAERIAPRERTWPLGYEGVIPMPPPTDDVSLFLEVNGGDGRLAFNKIAGAILSENKDEIGLAGRPLTADDWLSAHPLNVYTANYLAEQSHLLYVGQLAPLSNEPTVQKFDFQFEKRLALTTKSCSPKQNGSVELTLEWFFTGAPFNTNQSIFVHLWQNGEIVDQADGQFLTGLFPINTLAGSNQRLTEKRLLIPNAPPPYRIGIGLYNPADGVRSPAEDSNRQPIADNYIWIDCNN